MRYNKKNTKKAIQRKLTTRKQRKNNRSLPRRTQYKTHKSYKQMKGGTVRTTIVKTILNPSNDDPSKFEQDNPMFVGALIIKQYNELKDKRGYLTNLPDIPNSQAILTANQNTDVDVLARFYDFAFKSINETPVVEYSQFFSDLKAFRPDEFRMWLTYILEGNVYKKKLPFYTDNEFHKFKLLALSLHKLWRVWNQSSSNSASTPKQVAPPEYEKYEVFDIGGLKGFLSNFVGSSPILCEMCCVISLIRDTPKNWVWESLSDSEKLTISPNQYCANRRYKRLIVSSNSKPEPLSKFNVFKLTYQMQTVADYIRANDIITIIVKPMLAKLDIEQIKTLFEETAQFKQIIIQDKNGFYKYYEFKIRRSSIVDPTNKRFFIPVIICTLSGFDEDGICDFEFVYVCVPKPNPPQSGVPVEKGYDTKVKQETFYKLLAEMTRIQSLLGGQTWTAPTTAEGTRKQYYDTKSLKFEETRTGIATDGTSNESLRVLVPGEDIQQPCTLILNYEHNQETKKDEPVWKAAQATSTQIAAFKRVDEYLVVNKIKTLDDTMICVYKISNDRPSPDNITVFVEVKKLGTNGELLRVVYQALGGERYEVYNNSTNARVAAELNKAHYNWAEDIGMV